MKTDAPPIAKTELICVRGSGERVSIVAEIGQPYRTSDGFWRTPVALHGLDGRLCDIGGEDSLQSLSLAVEMVHRRLASVLEAGEQLLDSEGSAFPLEAYFANAHDRPTA
jgi:hypothetical protein